MSSMAWLALTVVFVVAALTFWPEKRKEPADLFRMPTEEDARADERRRIAQRIRAARWQHETHGIDACKVCQRNDALEEAAHIAEKGIDQAT